MNELLQLIYLLVLQVFQEIFILHPPVPGIPIWVYTIPLKSLA